MPELRYYVRNGIRDACYPRSQAGMLSGGRYDVLRGLSKALAKLSRGESAAMSEDYFKERCTCAVPELRYFVRDGIRDACYPRSQAGMLSVFASPPITPRSVGFAPSESLNA